MSGCADVHSSTLFAFALPRVLRVGCCSLAAGSLLSPAHCCFLCHLVLSHSPLSPWCRCRSAALPAFTVATPLPLRMAVCPHRIVEKHSTLAPSRVLYATLSLLLAAAAPHTPHSHRSHHPVFNTTLSFASHPHSLALAPLLRVPARCPPFLPSSPLSRSVTELPAFSLSPSCPLSGFRSPVR